MTANPALISRKEAAAICGVSVVTGRPLKGAPKSCRCYLYSNTGERPHHDHVYFIRGADGGNIKIGIANRPHIRLSELQSGSPVPLKIIASFPGTRADEQKLHRVFASVRQHREWFAPAPELLEFIGSIRKARGIRPWPWKEERA